MLGVLLIMTTEPNIMFQRSDEHRIGRRTVRPVDDDVTRARVRFKRNGLQGWWQAT